MFDDYVFLLRNVRYVLELKQKSMFISMFNELSYCTRIEHEVLKNLHGALIMT